MNRLWMKKVRSAVVFSAAIGLICFGSPAHSWTVINLHPAGAAFSEALGVHGGQQAGIAIIGGVQRAVYWTGSPGSWVDLHPAGASFSEASGVESGQKVGRANIGGWDHASLW
ncbi:MAG: hypothetical protein K6T17_02530, partial [Fimbriimonadales bacterium]|nr:hypothetical protein [Fimbriimonadales bacterium]